MPDHQSMSSTNATQLPHYITGVIFFFFFRSCTADVKESSPVLSFLTALSHTWSQKLCFGRQVMRICPLISHFRKRVKVAHCGKTFSKKKDTVLYLNIVPDLTKHFNYNASLPSKNTSMNIEIPTKSGIKER